MKRITCGGAWGRIPFGAGFLDGNDRNGDPKGVVVDLGNEGRGLEFPNFRGSKFYAPQFHAPKFYARLQGVFTDSGLKENL